MSICPPDKRRSPYQRSPYQRSAVSYQHMRYAHAARTAISYQFNA
ncbi:hypothetical protein [Moorena sp. SIO1F2]|nr:hypothetical protein [Moorena sp. SIO1F2]